MSTIKLHVGCSGWSYRDWLGAFYPRHMDPSKFLQYYARVFDCVEIDSTFYKIPSKRIVSRWHDSTPESFGFVAKMFKGITHDITNVIHTGEIHSLLPTYLGAMSRLGDKLKAILVQFPPSLDAGALDAVAKLIKMLPKDTWFAMEFRHRSWFEEDTGISLVQDIPSITIAGSIHPSIQPFIQETGDFYLFRFIGDREISSFGHIEKDRYAQVKEIHEAIQREVQDIRDTFVFFNNHYAGFAPASASQYMEVAGLEAVKFPVPRSGQASLFDFES